MNPFRFALLCTLGTTALAAPASAWPVIDVTASEVLSVDPPRVRTTFDLSYAGYQSFDTGYFHVTPLDAAALHIYECAGPPLWVCGPYTPASEGGVFFSDGYGSGAPYAPVNTFSIVTDQADPCVRFDWFDPVLTKAPTPTTKVDHHEDVCLIVDMPVPTRVGSWGSVKSLYR